MVGVFDPKSETTKTSGSGRLKLSIGVLAIAIGGIGVMSWSALTSSPSTEADVHLASLEAPQISEAPDEPQLILTSFQELEPLPQTYERTDELQPRDTLTDLMDRLGVSRSEANSALYSLYDEEFIDPRRVRPGLEVTAHVEAAPTDEDPDAVRLIGLTLKHASEASLVVSRTSDGGFTAHELHTRLMPVTRRVSGTVQTSLYEAALDAGAHDAQVFDFAQIYAYDVDFQREMRVGDEFEIVFEEYVDERGNYIRSGDILFAALDGYATDREFYRFTPSDDGITDYFDAEGEAARKFLMKTPINGARLSSNFGYRTHPISGYTRLHKGTDFAAPTGTPVMAAGNGTIERASRFGTYGNYVRIRHANGYQTAYAHLNGYGPGIRSGVRVQQGDIIGYVGSTGASTGPHLHYEVLENGNHINAMSLDLPTGRQLEGPLLEEFNEARAEIDRIRGVNETETLFASSSQLEEGEESTLE